MVAKRGAATAAAEGLNEQPSMRRFVLQPKGRILVTPVRAHCDVLGVGESALTLTHHTHTLSPFSSDSLPLLTPSINLFYAFVRACSDEG